MTEADTNKKAYNGGKKRPENSVEDRPYMHRSRKHGPRLDVPWVVETRHWLAVSNRVGVQLTTEIIDTFTIRQRVAGALLQCALQHT